MGTVKVTPTNKIASALFPTSLKQDGRSYKLRAISTTVKRGLGESLIGKLEGKRTITKLRKVLLVYEAETKYSKTTYVKKKKKK